MVRASKHKTIFDKGYMPNWTKEHYTGSQAVPPRRGINRRVYKLVDYNDKNGKGTWYPEEIREISDNQYRIENNLRKRTLPDGTNELFVRWEGWPDKYSSWRKVTDKYDVIGELWVSGLSAKHVKGNPSNKPSLYETDVAKLIGLSGNWDLALTEISYPHNWPNLDKTYKYFVLKLELDTADISSDFEPDAAKDQMNLYDVIMRSTNFYKLWKVDSEQLSHMATMIYLK